MGGERVGESVCEGGERVGEREAERGEREGDEEREREFGEGRELRGDGEEGGEEGKVNLKVKGFAGEEEEGAEAEGEGERGEGAEGEAELEGEGGGGGGREEGGKKEEEKKQGQDKDSKGGELNFPPFLKNLINPLNLFLSSSCHFLPPFPPLLNPTTDTPFGCK